MVRGVLAILIALIVVACRNPEGDRIRATSKGKYDPKTGRLIELTYDRNKNGLIDTWVRMDGARPVDATSDTDEDGRIDRWEYYDDAGRLVRVGESRGKTGRPDLWAYLSPDGSVDRVEFVEVSNVTGREGVVRREFYRGTTKLRAEEDTDGDGVMDRWETFENGRTRTVEFDDARTRDGKPAQRLTYDDRGALVSVESEPDGQGGYKKKRVIQN